MDKHVTRSRRASPPTVSERRTLTTSIRKRYTSAPSSARSAARKWSSDLLRGTLTPRYGANGPPTADLTTRKTIQPINRASTPAPERQPIVAGARCRGLLAPVLAVSNCQVQAVARTQDT